MQNMNTIGNIRTRLIDRILTTNNKNLLIAIENIFVSTQKEAEVVFSSEQIEMLLMSENDINKGDLISESELEKSDRKWLV